MRLSVLSAVTILILHVARAPDVLLLPDVAQDLWPVPRLVLPKVDLTLVEASVMEGWETRPTIVTAEEVRTDRVLWREMFFRNWDRLPSPRGGRGPRGRLTLRARGALPSAEHP